MYVSEARPLTVLFDNVPALGFCDGVQQLIAITRSLLAGLTAQTAWKQRFYTLPFPPASHHTHTPFRLIESTDQLWRPQVHAPPLDNLKMAQGDP